MTPLLCTGAAGLAALGLLLDEESGDAEEQRRRIEASFVQQGNDALASLVHHTRRGGSGVWVEYLGAL